MMNEFSEPYRYDRNRNRGLFMIYMREDKRLNRVND